MRANELITGIGIHLVVPLLGVIVFLVLCRRMQHTQIPSPPFLSYFILFATFGSWLMVCLTALFWTWSGMASLAVFGLMLVAPFVTAGIALYLYLWDRHNLSACHRGAYLASIAYSCLVVLGWLAWAG